MAESGSGGGEKTHDPTPKKLQTAREEGNVAQSREITILAVLVLFLISLNISTKNSIYNFFRHISGIMDHFSVRNSDPEILYDMTIKSLLEGIYFSLPLTIVGMIAILTCGLLQTSFLFRPQSLMPDINRLSPIVGLKRIFGINNLIEIIKNIIKLSVFGFILYGIAKNTINISKIAEKWTSIKLLKELVHWFSNSTFVILLTQGFIAILDDIWTRYHRFSKLKMSLQDIKEETKQNEGDPHVKSRQKMIRRKRARQRMMQAVKESTVIVMNPTHYAVALSYNTASGSAPKVVAKGMNDLALRIRDTAEDSKVPVVTNPSLARGLYTLPLEAEIPPEYFQAVAAIIAYVMKLKTPGSRTPRNK